MKWKKIGKALVGGARATGRGISSVNRSLDKAHFMKIDPKEFIGYNPPQHPATVRQAERRIEQKPAKEMTFCPMCGWVHAPHRHKMVEY
jgi:hypothetical protein